MFIIMMQSDIMSGWCLTFDAMCIMRTNIYAYNEPNMSLLVRSQIRPAINNIHKQSNIYWITYALIRLCACVQVGQSTCIVQIKRKNLFSRCVLGISHNKKHDIIEGTLIFS